MLRFTTVVVLLIIVIAGGTIGYSLIEGWSFNESLYMTFITATTVGFGEVRPLSVPGQQFTIILIILSIATVGYSVSIIINYVFEGQIIHSLRERRMMRGINRLRDHYIICGYGDVGKTVAAELRREKMRYVVIDRNPEQTESVLEQEVPHIVGDAADDEVLLAARIEHAAGLISTFPDDESNVFIVLSARQLNPDLTIVSQSRDERSTKKLIKAGADRIISTTTIAGQRMAAIALRPSVTQFLDVVMSSNEAEMRIEEIIVSTESPMKGKTLRETEIGRQTGALVIGITQPGGRTKINPAETSTISGMELRENDVLIALGSEDQLSRLRRYVETGKAKKTDGRLFGARNSKSES